MIAAGKIAPAKLIGRTITLEDAVPALMGMERSREIGISVITQF